MRSRGRMQLIGCLAALSLSVSGCGNRQSDEAVRQAASDRSAQVDDGGGQPGTGPAAEMQAETGTDPAVGDGGASAPSVPEAPSPAGSTAPSGAKGPSGTKAPASPDRASGAAAPPAPAASAAPATGGGSRPGPGPAAPDQEPAPAPAGGPAAAAPLAPVAVGSVGTLSGVVGQSIGGGTKAVQAWAGALNARGGLRGHPVKVFTADDAGDPARHQALVQELVESKGVIAFVYNAAPLSGHASVKYVERKRVPVIGTEATGRWTYESPMFFNQATSGELAYAAEIAGAAYFAIPAGKKKLGLVACSEGVSICEDAKKIAPTWASRLGYEFVQSTSASLAQPDYTAECLSARNAGVEIISVTMDANSLVRIAKSCASVGYKPLFAFAQQIAVNAMAKEPALEGAVGDALTLPWFLTDRPPIAEFQAALREHAPGQDLDGAAASGWASAKLFERAGAALSANPTSAEVLEGLWSLRDETLGGLTMPLSFRRDQPGERKLCYYPLQIKAGKFTSPDGGKLHCYEGEI